MRDTLAAVAVVALCLSGLAGCREGEKRGEHGEAGRAAAVRGPHPRDVEAREQPEGESEESGRELALDEEHDGVRNGVRLRLAYDAGASTFRGTVENTTRRTLRRVRVEVHLSNGAELGPTTPSDLAPGEQKRVALTVAATDFDMWTAHPEVGSGEHGHGEHGEEGGDEHGREGSVHP